MTTRPPAEEIRKRKAFVREQFVMRTPIDEIKAALMDPQGEFKLNEKQAVRDIAYIQNKWKEIRQEDARDRTALNIETAEYLLSMAMKDRNVRESRQCLELLCKLQGSFPEKAGQGALRDLIALAGQAARGELEPPRSPEVVPPLQIAHKPKPKSQSPPPPREMPKMSTDGATEDPDLPVPRPRGDFLPPALRISQEDIEKVNNMPPEELNALVEGRVKPGEVKIEDNKGGPTRVYGR